VHAVAAAGVRSRLLAEAHALHASPLPLLNHSPKLTDITLAATNAVWLWGHAPNAHCVRRRACAPGDVRTARAVCADGCVLSLCAASRDVLSAGPSSADMHSSAQRETTVFELAGTDQGGLLADVVALLVGACVRACARVYTRT